MDATSYSNFRQHLKDYMKRVNEDATPLLVTSKDPEDTIVVMSKRDFDANEETMYLLNNPELMARIKEGDAQVAAGKTKEHDLLTDFDDE
ncbi:type II toxin-antitoxin system Phd/YefM family antitoxin [Lacticaseibacillus zeae]|uniref:Antitoxin n=1 Tax=Lacticaseibacillus zeae TaxID=57037 RepID=A0A5R8LNX1_LACZE|nr:type II toxin-antitoxin system Phd/YefM family antitoxin [Lacticaseibacillus zeae]TLF38918.1 type II toxin-antitoxin system Phd/YefM family antitoxin [Lacticaseibacillus zeae]